jgi:uncharacterized protein
MKDNKELRRRALTLIEQQNTMTLATARDNIAWAAPLYYVYYKSAFFFFSDPNSRHIIETKYSQQASAAIYSFDDTWQGIKGLQMTGRIRQLAPGMTAIQAVQGYARKFSFTKDFFQKGQPLDLNSFLKRFSVRFYRFDPQIIYYLDNQIEFGFRKEVKLS